MEKIKCPCCKGSLVGEFDICDICGWENDLVQLDNPDYSGGANRMSLNEARAAYAKGKKVE